MPSNISPRQFGAIHSLLAKQGGFTVNPATGVAIDEGISVAPGGNELRTPAATSNAKTVSDYHGDAGNQEHFSGGAALGGWREKEEGMEWDYLDTPTVHPNTSEGQVEARTGMLKNNQIAAYDLHNMNTLLNPFHAKNQSREISSSDNSPEQQEMWRTMPSGQTGGKNIPLKEEGESFS